MTILTSYTFPLGSDLSGVKIRGYATGRYVNNSGSTQTISVSATSNSDTLNILQPSFGSSTAAIGWVIRTHFYFTQQITQTGTRFGIGATTEVQFTNAGTSSDRTGTYVSMFPMQVKNLPVIIINPALLLTLSIQFVPAGATGEVLESACAYMEAL